MTVAQAKRLKVGQQVKWNDGSTGTIRETSYAAVKIEWQDGKWALFPFHNPDTPWQRLSKG